ncbi:MAG: histidine phosphatase family protein [Alphaproteobacteria bacterium]|nr:histidine phosphatase family protein [Alphaproteobacteria bacterium]
MRLILARHGNTFEAGETPVWVGAREDLPLTRAGEDQSRAIGAAHKAAGIRPARIIAGPLKRTRDGAVLAARACGFAGHVEIDERLKEIDYGAWGGRSDTDIAAQWGAEAIEAWRERSVVPAGAGWSPHPAVIEANARAVLDAIAQDPGGDVLLISSNGILRYFHRLIAGAGAPPEEAKVKTGHMGAARLAGGVWRMEYWNLAPDAAREAMTS